MSNENRRIIGYFIISPVYKKKYQSTAFSNKTKTDILLFANQHNFGNVEFFSEETSVRKSWVNRKLSNIVDLLMPNDVLIVPSLTQLGKNIMDILEVLRILSDKQVKVCSVKIKENFILDVDDMQKEFMRSILGIFYGIENERISQGTKEGLLAAKAKGALLGRPHGKGKSKLDKFKPEILLLLRNGATKKYVAERYHCTPANLIHWLKINGNEHLRDVRLNDYYVAGLIAPTIPGVTKKDLLNLDFQDTFEVKRADLLMLREARKHKPVLN